MAIHKPKSFYMYLKCTWKINEAG